MIFKVPSNPDHSRILQPTEEMMEKEITDITTRGWATQMVHDCWLCPPIKELEDIKRSLWEHSSKIWMWDAPEKVLWQGDFIFVHIASCPTSGHWWEVLVSLYFTASLQVFIHIHEIAPEPSSGWTIPVLSDFPHRRWSGPFIVFVDLNWTEHRRSTYIPPSSPLQQLSYLTFTSGFSQFPQCPYSSTITFVFITELWFNLFTLPECCLPPWGYAYPNKYFNVSTIFVQLYCLVFFLPIIFLLNNTLDFRCNRHTSRKAPSNLWHQEHCLSLAVEPPHLSW